MVSNARDDFPDPAPSQHAPESPRSTAPGADLKEIVIRGAREHNLKEHAGVGGQRLDVAALAFREDGVERQGRLPGPGQAPESPRSTAPGADLKEIVIRGAREHNLKDVDLTIPPETGPR
jgi:hypothetical protein